MSDKEKLVQMLLRCSMSTGHADTMDDLIAEAESQIMELRQKNAELKELLQATVDYAGAFVSSPDISFYPSHKWHLVTNDKTTGDE